MNNKFVKKNLFMIVFMAMAVVAVIALLVMVSMEHKSMKEYDSRKKSLLKKINQIFNQRYYPVKVNVVRIEKDVKGYEKEAKKIQRKFGHPYEKALQRFAEVLGIPLNEFKAKFGEFWDSQKRVTTRDLIYRRYKKRKFSEDFPKHKSNWNEAMAAFMQEAQKMTIEDIDVSNVDGIFLAAMGKGRRFSDSSLRCQAFMKRMRIKMLEYFMKKKVGCEEASDFSFNHNSLPPEGDIEAIACAWEIVADLTKRIADSKADPKADTLNLVSFSKRSLGGAKDGNYVSYRFSFTVKADINTLRRLIKNLYEAYEVNRIYAIRDIKLYREVDRVDEIIRESERIREDSEYDMESTDGSQNNLNPASDFRGPQDSRRIGGNIRRPQDNRRVGSNIRRPQGSLGRDGRTITSRGGTAMSTEKGRIKRIVDDRKKVLGPKDPGYGRIIVGDNNTIRAEFDVDYIIYNDSPNM